MPRRPCKPPAGHHCQCACLVFRVAQALQPKDVARCCPQLVSLLAPCLASCLCPPVRCTFVFLVPLPAASCLPRTALYSRPPLTRLIHCTLSARWLAAPITTFFFSTLCLCPLSFLLDFSYSPRLPISLHFCLATLQRERGFAPLLNSRCSLLLLAVFYCIFICPPLCHHGLPDTICWCLPCFRDHRLRISRHSYAQRAF